MKTLLLILLTALLWVAVLDRGLAAWDTESTARNTIDNCLAAGNSPAACLQGE